MVYIHRIGGDGSREIKDDDEIEAMLKVCILNKDMIEGDESGFLGEAMSLIRHGT